VRLVAVGFGTERDDDGAAPGNALDFALQGAEFRPVDEIVGGIDGDVTPHGFSPDSMKRNECS
jgi:hypothetical protein